MRNPHATNITHQFDDGELKSSDDATISWNDLVAQLGAGGTFWLTTVDDSGRPHTRPVFAVVVDRALHVSSSPSTAKAVHLARGGRVSLAHGAAALDIVWTGDPVRVTGVEALHDVAAAYRSAYGWDVSVDGANEALSAPYGAPTAGPPPYHVFRIEACEVHVIATGEPFTGRSTRWSA